MVASRSQGLRESIGPFVWAPSHCATSLAVSILNFELTMSPSPCVRLPSALQSDLWTLLQHRAGLMQWKLGSCRGSGWQATTEAAPSSSTTVQSRKFQQVYGGRQHAQLRAQRSACSGLRAPPPLDHRPQSSSSFKMASSASAALVQVVCPNPERSSLPSSISRVLHAGQHLCLGVPHRATKMTSRSSQAKKMPALIRPERPRVRMQNRALTCIERRRTDGLGHVTIASAVYAVSCGSARPMSSLIV
mmetsp:Transcript_145649/g.378795  ORF Transcript_145649/g.378795 Transcript_145649/m.378795 type:complete len:247 (+) Transcript_145649:1684-2424(+)